MDIRYKFAAVKQRDEIRKRECARGGQQSRYYTAPIGASTMTKVSFDLTVDDNFNMCSDSRSLDGLMAKIRHVIENGDFSETKIELRVRVLDRDGGKGGSAAVVLGPEEMVRAMTH